MDFMIEANRIYMENEAKEIIAEVTFPVVEENVVNFNHTYVDNSLRGQGIAGKLMEQAVMKIKQENKKMRATCSYAASWMEKHPEYSELFFQK